MRISDWSSDVCSSDLPSRKSVNVLRAVSNVVSAPANAGPAVQAKRNRTSRARAIASSARPTLFRTSCMVGFLLIKTRPNRAQKEAHQSFRSRRSEEHTSELQSLMRISYAVFCLKKKKNKKQKHEQT